MMFQNIGTLSGYIKNMSLEHKWRERKQNPYMQKGREENPQIAMIKKQAEDVRKSQAISSIEGKLKSGMKLTSSDMEYLRNNSPELYKKAVQIEKEREEYRRELEQCRTKEDVERLNARKVQQFFSEAKAIENNSNIPKGKKLELLEHIAMRLAAMQNEHVTFLQTPGYCDLPENDREEDDSVENISLDEESPSRETDPQEISSENNALESEAVEPDTSETETEAKTDTDTPAGTKNGGFSARPYGADKQPSTHMGHIYKYNFSAHYINAFPATAEITGAASSSSNGLNLKG